MDATCAERLAYATPRTHELEEARMRSVFACLMLCFTATQALAASPKVEAAIKVFAAIADDPEKLRLFCRFVDAGDNKARSNRLIRETRCGLQVGVGSPQWS